MSLQAGAVGLRAHFILLRSPAVHRPAAGMGYSMDGRGAHAALCLLLCEVLYCCSRHTSSDLFSDAHGMLLLLAEGGFVQVHAHFHRAGWVGVYVMLRDVKRMCVCTLCYVMLIHLYH